MAKFRVQPEIEIERLVKSVLDANPNELKVSLEDEETAEVAQGALTKQRKSLIRVTRPFRRCWDLLTTVLCIYTCASVPFVLAYSLPLDGHFNTVQSVLDSLFAVDICLNFFTTYITHSGKEVQNLRKIVRKYLRSGFWVDFVATIPVDNFAVEIAPHSTICHLLLLKDMLRAAKVLRLPAIVRNMGLSDELKAVLKLVVIVVYLLLVAHLFGCLWFALVQRERELSWLPVPDFLTGETSVFEDDLWGQYTMVFYHSVWLLVGGEVGARSGLTATSAACMMVVGTVLTAMLFGEMEVLASSLNRRQTQLQEAFDRALTTTKGMRLPQSTVNRILDYITTSQSQHNAQEEFESYMKFVSPSLRRETTAALYTPIIAANRVMGGDRRVCTFLQQRMKTRFTQPEEEITAEGAVGDCLFLVISGKLSVSVCDESRTKRTARCLERGDLFGEVALLYDTVRTATVVSAGYCIIAELARKEFEHLANLFPQLIGKMREQAKEYSDPWKDFILSRLRTIRVVEDFPPAVMSELPYLIRFQRLQKGSYLFKPGDRPSEIFILAEGRLEISVTINEKNLHMQKNNVLPEGQREAEPLHARRRFSHIDYSQYEVPTQVLSALKRRTEVFPVFKNHKVFSSILLNESIPQGGEMVGDYPQEIVIEELMPGAVIGEHSYMLEDPVQVQCKVLKSAKVYSISKGLIERMQARRTEHLSAPLSPRDWEKERKAILDYRYSGGEYLAVRRMWKNAILKVIFAGRDRASTGLSFLTLMLPKLKAILACESAGNFALAAKVSRGEICPRYILPDGSLDPTMETRSSGKNAALSGTHPIMKAFRKVTATVTEPAGMMLRGFQRASCHLQERKEALHDLCQDANRLRSTFAQILKNINKPAANPQIADSPTAPNSLQPPLNEGQIE